MHSLFFKDNSEFNTGNTEIKLGAGEQGKKQYAIPLSLGGFWHTCAVGSNAIWAVVPLQSHSRLCSSPFPTLRHGSGISDPLAHEEAWPLVCSRAAGKLSGELCSTPNTPLSSILFFFRIELQFSPLEVHPSRSSCEDGGCLGSDSKCLTHLLFKSYAGCVPPPVLTLYDFICASGGGWLNIRREREHSIKLQAEKVCQLFFFSWLLGCTDSFWQFPLFCAHKISLIAEFSLR